MTSSVPGIPQILSIINVNGVFLQSTLNLAESYSPEQIVEKFFKLKFQCKTYISKEKNSKDAPPPSLPKTMLNSHVIFSYILETNIAWGGVGSGGEKVNRIISCVVTTRLPGKVSTLFVLIVVRLMTGIVDW